MFSNKGLKKLLFIELLLLVVTIVFCVAFRVPIFLIVIIGLDIVLVNVAFIFYAKKQYKKIRNLSLYMNNILNNDYSFDIRDYEEGDISNLKNDIYKMTVKLKEQCEISLKDKKYLEEVLSDISHQLKTPLTSMYVINDVLLNDVDVPPDKRNEFLLKNRTQLERIEWLVTTLLKMSRLDSGSETLRIKSIRLEELIKKVVEPLQIPMELKKQNLVLEYDSNISIEVDLNWTVEAFVNILKNAYEHTPNGGEISIIAKNTPIYTEINISDTGSGISDEDLPHIFERFYKGKSNKESIGIGLNMAKKILNLEKGDIKAFSSSEGTTFSIRIYKGNL